MDKEIIAHQIIQLIIKKKPFWTWKQKCVYTDGIDKTFIEITFFDESNYPMGQTCFQLETGIVQFSSITNPCSATTLVDFLLEILNQTKE